MRNLKIILICFLFFMVSCKKNVVTNTIPSVTDIFSVSNATVSNGQTIQFSLAASGKYYLKLYDTTNNQVVTKEKFSGIAGNNIKKIYTSLITPKSLYLYLTDSIGNQIKKTKITIN